MKLISQTIALDRLQTVRDQLCDEIATNYQHRAESCSTCKTPGACCLDEHFVNVHISRLEAVAITESLEKRSEDLRQLISKRIDDTIKKYALTDEGDTFAKTYSCPLYQRGTGCLVHGDAKPLPCIQHACYENKTDLPPDSLLSQAETAVDRLNRRTYGTSEPMLPIPLALRRIA